MIADRDTHVHVVIADRDTCRRGTHATRAREHDHEHDHDHALRMRIARKQALKPSRALAAPALSRSQSRRTSTSTIQHQRTSKSTLLGVSFCLELLSFFATSIIDAIGMFDSQCLLLLKKDRPWSYHVDEPSASKGGLGSSKLSGPTTTGVGLKACDGRRAARHQDSPDPP